MSKEELLYMDLQDSMLDKRALVVLAESDLKRFGHVNFDLNGELIVIDDRIRLCKERIEQLKGE